MKMLRRGEQKADPWHIRAASRICRMSTAAMNLRQIRRFKYGYTHHMSAVCSAQWIRPNRVWFERTA